MAVALCGSLRYRLADDGWKSAINNDGKGYYQYLRAWLLKDDPAVVQGEPWMFAQADEGRVIKYFVGAAVVQAPFVGVAHVHTLRSSGGPEDGYSLQYQLAIVLSAMVSLALGLHFTRKLLLACGIGDGATACTLVALTLGTGLLVLAVMHPGMSHVHSFAAVAILLWSVRRAVEVGGLGRWACVGALLGLVFILRPVDLLVVMAFPLATMGLPMQRSVWDRRAACVLMLAMLPVLLVQCAAWYVQCGEWVVRPYAGEGFHWDRPAVAAHLFAPRNGLLFLWPVLVLVLPGFVHLLRKAPLRTYPTVLSLVLFAYVTSAWWNWSYGDCFGQRPYVDLLPVLAIPLAYAFSLPSAPWRNAVLLIAMPFTLLNLFQSCQYARGILDPSQLDMARYRYLFLSTDPARGRLLGGRHDLPPYAPAGLMTVLDTAGAWPQDKPTMNWAMPPAMSGAGAWHLELAVTRTWSGEGVASGDIVVHGTSAGWPSRGIRFGLEQVPVVMGRKRWDNSLRIAPLAPGDTISVTLEVPAEVVVDSVYLRMRAPR